MRSIHVVFFTIFLCSQLSAQNRYWVFFIDKPAVEEMMQQPTDYLSAKALARRAEQKIALSSTDFPVSESYVAKISAEGATVMQKSKWLNAVSVKATSTQLKKIERLPFVSDVKVVRQLKSVAADESFYSQISAINTVVPYEYGASRNQIEMMRGEYLHNNDARGQNMLIAVLDGGFAGAEIHPAFDSLWAQNTILATHDFTDGDTNVFHNGTHGMSVLSVMAGNLPNELIGSAPKANYLLLKSEDQSSETPIEEDNWVAAAEFADSAGADVINSSLGYTTFDGGIGDYTWNDLDGRTATTTKAAAVAARKGILVVNSAGNEGANSWQKIITPADADSILAIGGVDAERNYAQFSSIGPTADGRIKPDVSAQAVQVILSSTFGTVTGGNGTSFASPLVAGLSACLWQRNPTASVMEIRNAIMESASQSIAPDNILGYGIPDFYIADFILKHNEALPSPTEDIVLMPNPFMDKLTLFVRAAKYPQQAEIRVFDEIGHTVLQQTIRVESKLQTISELANLSIGVYMVEVKIGNATYRDKLIKL